MKKNSLITVYLLGAIASSGVFSSQAISSASREAEINQRADLAEKIVLKWGGHVQEAYRANVKTWAKEMVPVFVRTSTTSLQAAEKANTFDAMNDALLQNSSAQINPALINGPKASKLLGDAATDLVFVPVTPCRILDTRVAGGAIAANTSRDFDVTAVSSYSFQGGDASNCNVGAAGSFAAAVINFTVVTPSLAGYITAFPLNTTQPLAATVNYTAGDIRGNLAIVKLDQGPSADEMSVYSFAQTHLVGDIVGYYINPQATNLNCVATTISTFNISANSTNFFNNPACPTDYTATTPYCWTASSGVFSQGGGYNANTATNATFCAWQNTTASTQQVFGGNVCCRVPGR
jgi:hypothetical protein